MIITAHIPIRNELPDSSNLWTPGSPVSEQQLVAKLQTYPNLILWLAEHVHRNTVTAFPSTDPYHPELGFREVETASLRNFPQEFRTFEIIRNSDNTISIFATDVDLSLRPRMEFLFFTFYIFYYFPAEGYNNYKQSLPDCMSRTYCPPFAVVVALLLLILFSIGMIMHALWVLSLLKPGPISPMTYFFFLGFTVIIVISGVVLVQMLFVKRTLLPPPCL